MLVTIIRFTILKRLVPGLCRNLTPGRRSGGPQRNLRQSARFQTKKHNNVGAGRAFRYKSSPRIVPPGAPGFPLQSLALSFSGERYPNSLPLEIVISSLMSLQIKAVCRQFDFLLALFRKPKLLFNRRFRFIRILYFP